MPIVFACDKCGKKMKVGEAHGGAEVNCTYCNQLTQVPELKIEQFVRAHLKQQTDSLHAIRFRIGWLVALGALSTIALLLLLL